MTQYNQRTGRPIRTSAGRLKQVAGYVSSKIIEDEDCLSTTTDDSGHEDDGNNKPRGRTTKASRRRKRKRSPSPPSPRIEPIIYDQEQEPLTDDELGGVFHRREAKNPPITLQFNVPLGFHGPLFVKLDSNMLLTTRESAASEMQPVESRASPKASPKSANTMIPTLREGFVDLPPEIRNKIYRYLFVADKELKIPSGKDGSSKFNLLCRSAQFLRSCKVVHSEGCSILYGENTFELVRHYGTRGPFWEPIPKEIGYQDVLHFLKMIGPENIQYLRDIKFTFDDACPRDTPYLDSQEERRYLNDEYLMHCLRILRDAKLRKLSMRFYGRRQLLKSDVKFLGYLEQIKADDIGKLPEPWYHSMHKISAYVWMDLEEAMTRKKKLYKQE